MHRILRTNAISKQQKKYSISNSVALWTTTAQVTQSLLLCAETKSNQIKNTHTSAALLWTRQVKMTRSLFWTEYYLATTLFQPLDTRFFVVVFVCCVQLMTEWTWCCKYYLSNCVRQKNTIRSTPIFCARAMYVLRSVQLAAWWKKKFFHSES